MKPSKLKCIEDTLKDCKVHTNMHKRFFYLKSYFGPKKACDLWLLEINDIFHNPMQNKHLIMIMMQNFNSMNSY